MDNSTVVLLNRPIWVAFGEDENDVREIKEIWGFILDERVRKDVVNIDDYLNYLCGVSAWQSQGGECVGGAWISFSGNEYHLKSSYIQDFMKKSRQKMNITYCIFGTRKILDGENDGIYQDEFLVSRTMYQNILEYGSIWDMNEDLNR